MSRQSVTARACANVALVKYWGKRPGGGNLPAVGSLSIGLEGLVTTTTLAFASGADEVRLNGEPAAAGQAARIIGYLDLWRRRFGGGRHFAVDTRNNFPTGAGLASSASGFAALALALDRLLGAGLDAAALSRLARQGSGSAARSLFGGFVELPVAGGQGEGPAARQLLPAEDWPLQALVAITETAQKPLGSTEAMRLSAASSPFHDAWVASHAADLEGARQAVLAKDFQRLADLAEHSCLKMHAAIMASVPPLIYWTPATLSLIHRVRALRAEGLAAFYTVDAGPQVKVICETAALQPVREQLAAVPGVKRIIHSKVGGAPSVTARAA